MTHADLATAIERALQSDKSALIVMSELRPLLPEVVRILRERQEKCGNENNAGFR